MQLSGLAFEDSTLGDESKNKVVCCQ
uniref:Uncharacterized protein n=1 Tax=Anguilla anguilla TaxID=7936 RepID=A0A0E9TXA5_ANGAN